MEDQNSEEEIGNNTVDMAMKFLLGGIVVTIYIIGFFLHTRLIKLEMYGEKFSNQNEV